jgi:hypothetical protein
MKVLFLDVDGVLNSLRSFCAAQQGQTTFEDWIFESADPIACRLIDRLVNEYDLKIVVSSSHRQRFFTGRAEHMGVVTDKGESGLSMARWEHNLLPMQEYFKKIGLQRADAIISCTPDIDNVTRGQQIQAWLEKHPEVTHYAIIDDNSDMTEEQLEHHFVHTCMSNGFTFENYRQIEEIMGDKSPKKNFT